MFRYSREKALKNCRWLPKGNRDLFFIEAFNTSGENYFRHEYLSDEDVGDWIAQRGFWSLPPRLASGGSEAITGGFRILFVERNFDFPCVDVSLSQGSYELLEKAFALHPSTLEAFLNFNGVCSRFTTYSYGNSRNLESVSMKALTIQDPRIAGFALIYIVGYVMKVYQKQWLQNQWVGNYCVSLTHDLASSMTTAIMCGADLIKFDQTNRNDIGGQLNHFHKLLETGSNHWQNPLFIPVCVFCDYSMRLKKESYAKNLSLVRAEASLGVSKVGTLYNTTLDSSLSKMEWSTEIARQTITQMTEHLATIKAEIILLSRGFDCAVSCAAFLQQAVVQLREHVESRHLPSLDELSESLNFYTSDATNNASYISRLNERASLQLDILYCFIAQNDNNLNARAAAAAHRDSMAMKVLALITAFFLPGAFVATLFSMGMFKWRINSKDGEDIVTSNFWIYWAVTIPLTLLIIFLWRFWWKLENDAFDRELGLVLKEVNKAPNLSNTPDEFDAPVATTQSSGFSWRNSRARSRLRGTPLEVA